MLGKLEAISAAGVSFEAQLLPENDGNPMLLSGENEAVMSAALQSWLQDVVGTAGGQINSVNNVSETGENGIRMIGLRANLSGSMEVVHRTIASIENNQPRLFIKEVVLNSTYQQTSAEEKPACRTDGHDCLSGCFRCSRQAAVGRSDDPAKHDSRDHRGGGRGHNVRLVISAPDRNDGHSS